MDENYKIAELKEKDSEYFKRMEEQMKMELGKDIVIIAYEKDNK
ncbi:MAG: hypothetical protein QM227_02985 [Bacillota bacterium]|nr:hypothetical protein [Bacillota bacterium]